MFDIVAGYPLYVYYIGLASQFFLFPLLATFCSVGVFNAYFLVYLAKDFAFETMMTDNAMIAHHIVSMVGTAIVSRSSADAWIITVGEIGSGSYNVYTLAKVYDTNVSDAYLFYAVVMTLSNMYCVVSIVRHKVQWHYKVPLLLLIVGRQSFLYQCREPTV